MNAGKDLDMAFRKSVRARDVGRAVGHSAKLVLTNRQVVNMGMETDALSKLRQLRLQCEVGGQAPLIVLHGRKFDSATIFTGSPVRLPALGLVAQSQSRRPIHFFVQRRQLLAIFADRCVELRLPIHDVPASSTAASCLHEALDTGSLIVEYQNEAEIIMSTAQICGMELDGCDGAAPNLKYGAWQDERAAAAQETEKDNVCQGRNCEICGNHSTAIHQSVVEEASGQEIVTAVGCFPVRMRSGGMLLRCLASLLPIIGDGLRPLDGVPDDDAFNRSYADYVKEHSLFFHNKYWRAYSESDEGFAKSLRALSDAWNVFFFWFNGRLDTAGVYFHYFRLSNLRADQEMQMAEGMAKATANLFLKSLPGKVEQAKWTKTAPAFDFAVKLGLPNDLVQALLRVAGSHMSIRVEGFTGDWKQLTFAESPSVRLQHSADLFACAASVFLIRLLATPAPENQQCLIRSFSNF